MLMGIETAFLLGVLVGHWILLFALWRAITRFVVLFNYTKSNPPERSADSRIIYLSPEEFVIDDQENEP
jgi:hypothetical protein